MLATGSLIAYSRKNFERKNKNQIAKNKNFSLFKFTSLIGIDVYKGPYYNLTFEISDKINV